MKTAEECFEKGNKFCNEQDYDQAIDCFNQAIELKPDYAEAYCARGNTYNLISEYEIALNDFDKAIQINPEYVSAYKGKTDALIMLRRDEEAFSLLDHILELNQDELFWVWFNRSTIYFDMGKFEEAVDAFNHITNIDKECKFAWVQKARALCCLSKFDEAVKSYDHALIIDPKDKDCLFEKASAMSESARCEGAIESFDKALAIDSNDAKIWNSRGVTMSRLQRWEEALENNDRALEINPNNAEIWKNRGLFFWGLKILDKAIDSFDKALNINPVFEQAWCWKGYVLIDLEKYDKANECFDKALAINPDIYQAAKGKIIILQKLGRYAEAAVAGAPLILMELANNKEMRRETWEASTGGDKEDLEYYKRMAKNEPNNPYWSIKIGDVYANLGNSDKAIEYYEESSNNDSDLINKLDNIPLYRVKSHLDKQNVDKALEELEKSKKYMRSKTKGIETIDIIHFFAKNIKDELKNNINETPFIDFTIEFIKDTDEYFKKMINSKDKNKDKYANMYMQSLLIVDLLHVKEENVSHYSTPTVATLLLSANEQGKISHFRLNDAKNCNDTEEGKTLLAYLFSENPESVITENNNHTTFIGCFTFDNNNLNQFRLYGKVDGHEATGVSIEVSSDYFESDKTQLIALPEAINTNILPKETQNNSKLSLYRCIYLDSETGVVESVAHIKEVAAKREGKKYDSIVIENIKAEAKELLDRLKEDVIKLDKTKSIPLLENLNALVKSYGYSEEQECRVVKILPNDNQKVKVEDNRRHIDYLPMPDYVKTITLPPNSTDDKQFTEILRREHIMAKVKISKHPFRSK